MTETATFAAGCFWGVQYDFDQLDGVLATEVGYTGGSKENPTYQEVCSKKTGHAEAVLVTYDPAKVSFETLLSTFFAMHDPTQVNRQGPDIGSQYRSAIFPHTPAQHQAARDAIEAEGSNHANPIATAVEPLATWWPAEEYHQKYFEKNGVTGCRI